MSAPWEQSVLDTAESEKEVDLTTYGRVSGKPSRRTIWITALDGRIYVRSGMGMTRDWPQNLVANQRAVLHMAGRDLPVRARHVTDPSEARAMHAPVQRKYDRGRPGSQGDEPLTPAEQAVFELTPE